MVSTNKAYIDQAKFLSTQARDPAPHYQHSQIGYNYRLSNICAGIGRGQLLVLDERVRQRRANFEYYQNELGKIQGVGFQPELDDSYSNRWLTCMLLESTLSITPENIRLALEQENIESRPLWKPMHLQPVFKDAPTYGGVVSEDLFKRGLCLPSGSNMSSEDRERCCAVIKKVLQNG